MASAAQPNRREWRGVSPPRQRMGSPVLYAPPGEIIPPFGGFLFVLGFSVRKWYNYTDVSMGENDMKRILILPFVVLLSACDKTPTYVLDQDAFCTGDGIDTVFICKDSDGKELSGRVVEYFDDGKIQRQFGVKNGLTDGAYRSYHANGAIAIKGTCKKGKENGFTKSFYENGNVQATVHYKDGQKDGVLENFYESGNIKLREHYKNGAKNGLVENFYENGKIKTFAIFKNDVLDGTLQEYSENGNVLWEIPYKDGKKEGVAKDYHENGSVRGEWNYKDGKLDGVSKIYHENGNVLYEDVYKDDVLDGVTKVYYEDGAFMGTVSYKNGKLDGVSTEYYKNGDIKSEATYKNGEKVKSKKWSPTECDYGAGKRKPGCLECKYRGSHNVDSIAPDGVIISGDSTNWFLYTNEKYAIGDPIPDPCNYYEYVGLYEYVSVNNELIRLHAYKTTDIHIPKESESCGFRCNL